MSEITVVREEIIPVHGTTKLVIGDPMYFEMMGKNPNKNKHLKNMTFDGNISSASLGIMNYVAELGQIMTEPETVAETE